MPKDSSKKNSKFSLIITILLFLALIGFSVVVILKQIKRDSEPLKNEAVGLLEDNKEAINGTVNQGIERKVGIISAGDHIWGPIGAKVSMIVYLDMDDEFSIRYTDTLKLAREEFEDDLVIAFRHFPGRANKNSFSAAMALECGAAQGKFLEFYNELIVAKKNTELGAEKYLEIVEELDLDVREFEACLKDDDTRWAVNEEIRLAKIYGVGGTPSSYVNGEIVPGAYPLEDFVDSGEFERKGLKNIIKKYLVK